VEIHVPHTAGYLTMGPALSVPFGAMHNMAWREAAEVSRGSLHRLNLESTLERMSERSGASCCC